MVVLKELIFNHFYFGRMCALERTDFEQFLCREGVVALKEPIFTVYTLGGCGGLERTDFYSFYVGRKLWS